MVGERIRLGLISGLLGLLPLVVAALLTWLNIFVDAGAAIFALTCLVASIALAGGSAGYLAGQRRRKRKEAKAFVGGTSGVAAGIIFGGALEGLFLYRFYTTPAIWRDQLVTSHPLRVSFAVLLLSSLIVVVAMLTAQFTARPLPPRGRTREMGAVRPPQQSNQPLARR
jgi:hypothetical protein